MRNTGLSRGPRVRAALMASLLVSPLASAVAASSPDLIPVAPDALARMIRTNPARAVVVNVWATWCVPCREELPDLLRVYREYRPAGLELVLVSADFERQAEQAGRFLAERGVDFRSYLKTGPDAEFIDALSPAWSGALPATFGFGADRRLIRWAEGKLSYDELRSWAEELLRR